MLQKRTETDGAESKGESAYLLASLSQGFLKTSNTELTRVRHQSGSPNLAVCVRATSQDRQVQLRPSFDKTGGEANSQKLRIQVTP